MTGWQGERAARVALEHLQSAVDALVTVDLSAVDGTAGPGMHAQLTRLAGRVQAVAARVLAKVEADGRWQAGTSRTFEQWAAHREGTSVGAARREAALGQALDGTLPRTAEAVAAGSLPLEHAQILAGAANSSARRDALASQDPEVNEAWLVRQAHRMGADAFRKTVRRWAHLVDTATAEAEHAEASAREHLTLTRRADGYALSGFLTPEHGETVRTALSAVAGVPAATDTRSLDRRQAAALVDQSRLVLDRGLAGAGQSVRPHLSVLVSFDSLNRQITEAANRDTAAGASLDWLANARNDTDDPWAGADPAELEDGTPLPPSVLARLACDSEITRIVFGPDSEVLDVGRARRTFTGQQRRAVIARDRTCRFPGCGAPPTLCEVHHVRWWQRDNGPTSIDNGILICWHHHDVIHQRNLGIARTAGRWHFTRHDGSPLAERPPGQDPPPPGAVTPTPREPHDATAPAHAPPRGDAAPTDPGVHQDEFPLSA